MEKVERNVMEPIGEVPFNKPKLDIAKGLKSSNQGWRISF